MIEDLIQRVAPAQHFAYRLLAHTKPSLCLDVGASSGAMARLMRRNAPLCRVMAFEPFSGNMRFLEEVASAEGGIEIIPKAASDHTGVERFHVGSVVTGREAGWEGFEGFSSVGRLVAERPADETHVHTVETVRIDDLVHERVGFMKVDVQGAELRVLKGAAGIFEGPGVELAFVEFDGDAGILHWFADRGFRLFDCEYAINNSDETFAARFMRDPHETRLSTGKSAASGYLRADVPRDIDGYAAWLRSRGGCVGYAWTDILAVSAGVERDVLGAVNSGAV